MEPQNYRPKNQSHAYCGVACLRYAVCERTNENNQEKKKEGTIYCVLCMCQKLLGVFYSLTHAVLTTARSVHQFWMNKLRFNFQGHKAG